METTRKNICLTITSLAMGGAEKQCLLLAKALAPFHNVQILIIKPHPRHQPKLEFLEEEGLKHAFLPANFLGQVVGFMRFLRRERIDFMFSFLPKDTLLAGICGKIFGVPHRFGGIRNSYLPPYKFIFLRLVHNHFLSYTIANNYSAREAAIKNGFKENVMVIHNGINIRPLRKTPKSETGSITIISLGRLVPQKDFRTALRVIVRLKERTAGKIPFKYYMVGKGPEEAALRQTIEAYGLSEEVELMSDPKNVYALLEEADIYLCTSIFEGVSNAIMEAMNCALPVVATDAGDNSRLVDHEKNGFIADIGDAEGLSQYVYELIKSKTLREQMGIESYNHLRANFSYEKFQARYLQIISGIEYLQIRNGDHYFSSNS